ncbi:MAG: exodeoxyribonuclease V subunit alpha [Methylococcaceae bacterium]|nr:exodeoxyribonuclease V subunit alpha [Methylococcaceae bacterium]
MKFAETPLSRQFAACLRRFDPDMEASVGWAARLVSQAVDEGHVCLDLRRHAGREWEPGLCLPQLDAWKQALEASRVTGGPGEFKPLILEGDRLYLARYWLYEQGLADSLLARAGTICEEVDVTRLRDDLDRLFLHNAGQIQDWQKTAAAIAVLRRFCVISGGPGTGKTSTVVRILAALQAQAGGNLSIALAAPTGKAAARMQDSIRSQKQQLGLPPEILDHIPETASTLHRLLGSKPDSVYFRHHRDNLLPVDVVVVDEASMIDLALMAKLTDALPARARLILLGDKDQLAAVEAGAVFADLCAGQGYSPDFREGLLEAAGVDVGASGNAPPLGDCIIQLRRSHRFGGDSGIGELARRVQQGESEASLGLLSGERLADLGWCSRFGQDDLLERMDLGYREYFQAVDGGADEREILAAFNRFRVLAAHRLGPSSAASANRDFEFLRRERLRTPAYERWYPGRAVIVTRNDYGLKLFNGDVGICLRLEGQLRVCFEEADGKLRSFAPARLPEHEPVYAMTVHKSQGSEFHEVLLLLPEVLSPVLNRPLVYTAITRAKSRAEIWGREEVLAAAIQQMPERTSGLREKLWGGV